MMTRALPAISTDLPAISTDLPAISTALPVISTDLPVISTDLPVISTDLPVISTDLPVISTDLPVISTEGRNLLLFEQEQISPFGRNDRAGFAERRASLHRGWFRRFLANAGLDRETSQFSPDSSALDQTYAC